MRKTLFAWVVLVATATASAQDVVYEGTWVTTNRKLDGPLTCVVTDPGDNQWQGHFYGAWQGRPFSYTVRFRGPPEKLHGKATIDGADYEWTGAMGKESPGGFKGSFGGTRYVGSFDLKQKTK
jgi:hypothetical protein